jgi:hypothetical protein
MKVIIDRDLCNATLPFCQRCSAALIRFPESHDRPCIRNIVYDGRELLSLELRTDGRVLQIELTEELRELAGVEGWEALVNFAPALFSTGAQKRWRALRRLPAPVASIT